MPAPIGRRCEARRGEEEDKPGKKVLETSFAGHLAACAYARAEKFYLTNRADGDPFPPSVYPARDLFGHGQDER